MTVEELIKDLQQYPGDAKVILRMYELEIKDTDWNALANVVLLSTRHKDEPR